MKLTILGKWLRKLRLENSELLKEMAERLSITPAYLSSIENGKRKPTQKFANSVVQEYDLKGEEKASFLDAVIETIQEVNIQLTHAREDQKDLGVVLARKFDELNPEDVKSIMSILNKKGR